jgi:HSP20 family protein
MHTVSVDAVNLEDQSAPEVWSPAISIREDADNLYVEAEIPGVEPDEVEIELQEGVISFSGMRLSPVDEEDYLFVDRAFGPFSRSCVLPLAVEADEMTRQASHGLLCVTVPKRGHGHHKRHASGLQDYWIG